AVPTVVPGTETVTPGIGSPCWSTTVPLTVTSTMASSAGIADPGSASFSRTPSFEFPSSGSARDEFREYREKSKAKRKYFPLPKHACKVCFIDMSFMLTLGEKRMSINNYDESL